MMKIRLEVPNRNVDTGHIEDLDHIAKRFLEKYGTLDNILSNKNRTTLTEEQKECIKGIGGNLGCAVASALPYKEEVLVEGKKLHHNPIEVWMVVSLSNPDNELERAVDHIIRTFNPARGCSYIIGFHSSLECGGRYIGPNDDTDDSYKDLANHEFYIRPNVTICIWIALRQYGVKQITFSTGVKA